MSRYYEYVSASHVQQCTLWISLLVYPQTPLTRCTLLARFVVWPPQHLFLVGGCQLIQTVVAHVCTVLAYGRNILVTLPVCHCCLWVLLQAICRSRASFSHLIQGFQQAERCNQKPTKIISELRQPPDNTKRVGDTFAERLHKFLTCEDPEVEIEGPAEQ